LNPQAANLLFAVVSRRHERGSIIVTFNRLRARDLGGAMVAVAANRPALRSPDDDRL